MNNILEPQQETCSAVWVQQSLNDIHTSFNIASQIFQISFLVEVCRFLSIHLFFISIFRYFLFSLIFIYLFFFFITHDKYFQMNVETIAEHHTMFSLQQRHIWGILLMCFRVLKYFLLHVCVQWRTKGVMGILPPPTKKNERINIFLNRF